MQYFNLLKRIYNTDKNIMVLPIDFNKSWYSIFFKQKMLYILGLLLWCIAVVWDGLGPIFIAISIQNQSYQYLGLTILGYLMRFTVSYFALILMTYIEKNINLSIQYQAAKFFLTVDPIAHSTRSSGQIISKINRGAESSNTLNAIIIFSISTALISTITSIAVLFNVNLVIGFIALVLNILFGFVAVTVVSKNTKALNPMVISQQDDLKSLQIESLQQIQLVRSSFATNEQDKRLFKESKYASIASVIKDLATISVMTPLLYLLILGTGIISFLLLSQVKLGNLQPILAISMVVTYLESLNKIMAFSNQADKLVTSIANIQDLFSFIRSFGKQTYPVLEGEVPPNLKVRP